MTSKQPRRSCVQGSDSTLTLCSDRPNSFSNHPRCIQKGLLLALLPTARHLRSRPEGDWRTDGYERSSVAAFQPRQPTRKVADLRSPHVNHARACTMILPCHALLHYVTLRYVASHYITSRHSTLYHIFVYIDIHITYTQ